MTVKTLLAAIAYTLSISISVVVLADGKQKERKLYRYTNEAGVKVIGHSMPAHLAQNGYEVLSASGFVLKTVAPALSADELQKRQSEHELLAEYEVLKRRYNSVGEIERAKKRRLDNINTNLAILRGNIGSIENRIENLMSDAAALERGGKPVSARVLQQLSDAQGELEVAKSALESRETEYQNTLRRFESAEQVFANGQALVEERAEVN